MPAGGGPYGLRTRIGKALFISKVKTNAKRKANAGYPKGVIPGSPGAASFDFARKSLARGRTTPAYNPATIAKLKAGLGKPDTFISKLRRTLKRPSML